MNKSRSQAAVPVLVAAFLAASNAAAAPNTTTFRETFDNGSNNGGWSYGNGFDIIRTTGGNPGAYLENTFLDTFAPQPSTVFGQSNQFSGDYRARQVLGVAVDLKTFSVDFSTAGRPLSLLLKSDAGTPLANDDCTIYFLGTKNIPVPGNPWTRFKFLIPASSMVAPAGWDILNGCPGLTRDEAWNEVITDVEQVTFFYGDPTFFFIFQVWDVGMDNPAIRTAIP